jgi:hypothetical protein
MCKLSIYPCSPHKCIRLRYYTKYDYSKFTILIVNGEAKKLRSYALAQLSTYVYFCIVL